MMRVRELRERMGIAAFAPATAGPETISIDDTAHRLGICVGSVYRLIREGKLPATQLMPWAPWKVSVEAIESETVQIGGGKSSPAVPEEHNLLIHKEFTIGVVKLG